MSMALNPHAGKPDLSEGPQLVFAWSAQRLLCSFRVSKQRQRVSFVDPPAECGILFAMSNRLLTQACASMWLLDLMPWNHQANWGAINRLWSHCTRALT